jgi:hypothetical protein
LIVGTRQTIERGDYRSNVKPASVLHSLAAWEVRYDCPVVFEPDPEAAACRVESWAFWYAREYVEHVNVMLRASGQTRPHPSPAPRPDAGSECVSRETSAQKGVTHAVH